MCFVHNDSVNITQWNFRCIAYKIWGEKCTAEHNKIYGNVFVWQLNFINRLGNLLTAINFGYILTEMKRLIKESLFEKQMSHFCWINEDEG